MKSMFSGIHQIGLVVKNLKETIRIYTDSYGIGPWNVWEFNSDMVQDMQVKGEKVDYRMLVATCKTMNVDWEIIEPLDDKSIFKEFLAQHGEGLQHISYIPYNYDEVVEYLLKKKVDIYQYGNLLGKHKYIFFDTEYDAKHIMETYVNLPGFIRREPQFLYPLDKEKNILDNSVFNNIKQIGIVVKDIKKTASVLQNKYTLVPWEFYKFSSSDYSYDAAVCEIGGVGLKIVAPNNDKNIFFKQLDKYGEGLHHICFSVNNMDYAIERIKKLGRNIIQTDICNGQKYIYFSTESDLKFVACFYKASNITK